MGFAVGRSGRARAGQVGHVLTALVQLAVLVGLLGGALLLRTASGAPLAAATPQPIAPEAASAALAAALASKEGVSFTVVQHTTVHAKPGGPLLDVADPADARKIVGQTDHLEQASYIERGGVSADGFWMELRDGPVGDAAPDFAGAQYEFGAIVKAGKTYRNDGAGWYETDQPPGIGIDPATAALLPQLVGHIDKATDLPSDPRLGSIRQQAASASIADIPGLMAVDLAAASELTGPIEYGFDDAGKLVRMHAVVRNTQVEDWDYLVDVVITLGYGDAGPIPDPKPVFVDPNVKG